MREIELKAHASASVKERIDSLFGAGKEVHKLDHYLRWPGVEIQAMRIRSYKGIIEMTCKKTMRDALGENNSEYEFQAPSGQLDDTVRFFHALGLEDFFIKKKDGWEWHSGRAHIELLEVNDLGFFIEIEILLPFDADPEEIEDARVHIHRILNECGVGEDSIETRSYREMILSRG